VFYLIKACFLEDFILLRISPEDFVKLKGDLAIALVGAWIGVFDDQLAVFIDEQEVSRVAVVLDGPSADEDLDVGGRLVAGRVLSDDPMHPLDLRRLSLCQSLCYSICLPPVYESTSCP
jgi:hypothetical protein